MKNASKHAAELKSLQQSLDGAAPRQRPSYEPLRAIVLGVLREDCDDDAADAAMGRFDDEFVDVNELRVATELELADLMGEDYPDVNARSVRLRELLMALFDGEGRLSLDRLSAMTKKDQRAALRKVPLISPFVEAHAMLLGFNGSALPVDGRMLAHLIERDCCDEEADAETAQKFLEQHLRADEYWAFYAALRGVVADAQDAKDAGKKGGRRKAKAAPAESEADA